MQYRRSVQGRMLLTELESYARTESKRMTNHNTPQLSRMGLPVQCATFHGLSRLNTRAVVQLSLLLPACKTGEETTYQEIRDSQRSLASISIVGIIGAKL
jgi:hypothetical protein